MRRFRNKETFEVVDHRDPPPMLHHTSVEEMWLEMIIQRHVMPCCGLPVCYRTGPQQGNCTNIQCAHCMAAWNINPPFFIQRIGIQEVKPE